MRSFLALCGQQPASDCAFSAGSPAATRAKFAALRAAVDAPCGDRGRRAGDLRPAVPDRFRPTNVVDWQPVAGLL